MTDKKIIRGRLSDAVLNALDKHGPLGVRELIGFTGGKKSSVYQALNQLMSYGYVQHHGTVPTSQIHLFRVIYGRTDKPRPAYETEQDRISRLNQYRHAKKKHDFFKLPGSIRRGVKTAEELGS